MTAKSQALPAAFIRDTLERIYDDQGADILAEWIARRLLSEANASRDPHRQQAIRTIAANLQHCAQACRDVML